MSIEVKGVTEAIRTLNKVEPGLRSKMVKEIRKVAQPVADAINAAIPVAAPLSGMDHAGRTGWQKRRKVAVNVSARKPRRRLNQPPGVSTVGVVRVETKDPATAMADMAGKSKTSRALAGMARPNFAEALGGTPSRYMWPTAEKTIPTVEKEVEKIVKAIQFEANKELMKL